MEFEAMYNRHNRSQAPSSSPPNAAPVFHSLGPLSGSMSMANRPSPGPLTSPMENTEDGDTSSRPRLTQEQITILEQEFGKLPKPSTDFKKHLADKIGLTLARVNNWYQNRRAKTKNGAKAAEAQFEVRTEDLQLIWPTVDQTFQPVPSYFDNRGSASQLHNSVMVSPPADQHQGLTSFFGSCNFDFNFDSLPNGVPEVVPATHQDTTSYAFGNLDFSNKTCTPGINVLSADCKMPVTETVDFGADGYSPETPLGFAIPQDLPSEQTTDTMYHMVEDGLPVGNFSNQTFMSATSSSDGEQPRMMTPPERPSPISLQPQEDFDRRPSITGALANDFQNTFHLQRQRSGQTMYDQAFHNADASTTTASSQESMSAIPAHWNEESVPSTLTINTSIDNTSGAPGTGLAARRKGPRPAPLVRPDVPRSFSYNGPLTSSPPSARKSSLNPLHPVRRIRSNLDVFNGRVSKPRSSSAHQSPRSTESRLQGALSQEQSRCTSTTFQAPPTPLSAVHGNDNSLGFMHQFDSSSNQGFGTPTTFDGSFNLNSPPITPYDSSPFSTERGRGVFLGHAFDAHQPPQSAPPQKTSFFMGDSPPMASSNLSHLSWQAPHEIPSSQVANQSATATMQTQYQGMSGHFEQPQLPSTYSQQQVFQTPPQHQLPSQPAFNSSPDQMFQNVHQLAYPQYQSPPMPMFQNVYELQTQPQQLEIKVELGPQPKGPPQPRKQYTFSNSTPDDFNSLKDES